jgi:hypothetical protein
MGPDRRAVQSMSAPLLLNGSYRESCAPARGRFGTVRHPAISCDLLKDSTVKSNALIVQRIGITLIQDTRERTHVTNSPSCALHVTPPGFALMPRDDEQFECRVARCSGLSKSFHDRGE